MARSGLDILIVDQISLVEFEKTMNKLIKINTARPEVKGDNMANLNNSCFFSFLCVFV